MSVRVLFVLALIIGMVVLCNIKRMKVKTKIIAILAGILLLLFGGYGLFTSFLP